MPWTSIQNDFKIGDRLIEMNGMGPVDLTAYYYGVEYTNSELYVEYLRANSRT